MPTHKSPKVNSLHRCGQSPAPANHRDDDKVSIPDEEEMNRNLKALHWESDNNNSSKDGNDDGDDDFKELAQELNKEEGLGEPVQQTLANILEAVWQNPQSYEKMKDKMKIYPRPENCSSLVVKKCNKEIWQAHLTSRDRAKDLQQKNNRELTAKDIRNSIIPVIKTCIEAMTFLGHANQEADTKRRTNIAMSLPNELYPQAKDVQILSEWLFGVVIKA